MKKALQKNALYPVGSRIVPFWVRDCTLLSQVLNGAVSLRRSGGFQPPSEEKTFAITAAGSRRYVHLAILGLFLSTVGFTQDSAKIVIETQKEPAKLPRIWAATVNSTVAVGREHITHESKVDLTVIQGTEGPVSLRIFGPATVETVESPEVTSWAIREKSGERHLEFSIAPETTAFSAKVILKSPKYTAPSAIDIPHLGKGTSAAFTNTIQLNYIDGMAGTAVGMEQFLPLSSDLKNVYYTAIGGKFALQIERDHSAPPPVAMTAASLTGVYEKASQSILFTLKGLIIVTEPDATLNLLRGKASLTGSKTRSTQTSYSIRLIEEGDSHTYQLKFPTPGTYPLDLEFAARIENNSADFSVASRGVTPISIQNLGKGIEFINRGFQLEKEIWKGFLPANGQVNLTWKEEADAGGGKLFFNTHGTIETRLGTGLISQTHDITYRVLQGELKELSLKLIGAGEVIAVTGEKIQSWKVAEKVLQISLSEAILKEGMVSIKTQTPLDTLPTKATPLRLEPVDSIRHAGFIRLANEGSVRLEPSGLVGLTQLAPDKFPGPALESRQVFVYRFPSANYQFEVGCDRIQPEVHVSEVTLHKVSESDQTLHSAVELDVREAPIREWDISIPSDYSVVSVTGAEIGDYIISGDKSSLKVIFASDVSGRKLINLQLEKNTAATTGTWALPKLAFPNAKSVRGDLGLAAAPGFRLTVPASEQLTERPLASFPGDAQHLQHYFRMRDADWTASVSTEVLPKSIQADVFHLYSLSNGTAYGSVLINYFIVGAPSSEFSVTIPAGLENVVAEGRDLRSQRVEQNTLKVSLHQAVMGAFTLLVTFEQPATESLSPGGVFPSQVQSETGYVQIVSPDQVEVGVGTVAAVLLEMDHLELPPEFRLLSASPSLGIWQYNARPFDLQLNLKWLDPERTLDQVVEFAEASTFISRENETVTDLIYYVKSRDNRPLSLTLPPGTTIWDVRTNGRNVASRKTGDITQIPLLPTQGNEPLTEVRMRLGNVMEKGRIHLPTVTVPVLKTEWLVTGEHNEVIQLKGKYQEATAPVLPPSGFNWVGTHGMYRLFGILVCVGLGIILRSVKGRLRWLALLPLVGAVVFGVMATRFAWQHYSQPSPLKISLPILAAGEPVVVETKSAPLTQVAFSFTGSFVCLLGLVLLAGHFNTSLRQKIEKLVPGLPIKPFLLFAGLVLLGGGTLLFINGGGLFFAFLSLAIFGFLLLPELISLFRSFVKPANLAVAIMLLGPAIISAEPNKGSLAFDSLYETWKITHTDNLLSATVTAALSGKRGDRFELLEASGAKLTAFVGDGVLLKTEPGADGALNYLAIITSPEGLKEQKITFSYQLDLGKAPYRFKIPTGRAAIHQVNAGYDVLGWEFVPGAAARMVQADSKAEILLLPIKEHEITLRPKERDRAAEPSEFFVESQQVYIPSPGVIDGIHQFQIRSAQGVVKGLKFKIPTGCTVSDVLGPVASWQFNPVEQIMIAMLEPPQANAFTLKVATQSGLSAFPTQTTLGPLLIEGAAGQTGILGLSFGGDAQPGTITEEDLLMVNLDDFDKSLLPGEGTILNRAYRFKEKGGKINLALNEVAPEVRVELKQVISLGDENVLCQIEWISDISRAGIFQLHGSIPKEFEINSLSGETLHHWSDQVEGDNRIITLHLNGKTMGRALFALSMTSPTPNRDVPYPLPRFTVTEATRQSGEIIVQAATGMRLVVANQTNVSELDPRTLGAQQKTALAFRLLQKDWAVNLAIETLAPRVTGEILHDITIREAQVRTAISGIFEIENASIRTLQVRLPLTTPETIRTLRANGKVVSGITKIEGEADLWEIQLKRWLTGELQVQLEWEERLAPESDRYTQKPVIFPSVKQPRYHVAVRPTGRLEVERVSGDKTWLQGDWKLLSKSLRESINRIAPALALKARTNPGDLEVAIKRHTLADALKLRITRGEFRTVLSPHGTRLTSVNLEVEVIQRSPLTLTLPADSELFCLFVNREAVQPVQLERNHWQFPVLPDANGRKASVQAIYLEPGDSISPAKMNAPLVSVPMENIIWEVLSPPHLKMSRHRGNLNLLEDSLVENQDRTNYLTQAKSRRDEQSAQAVALLEKANQLLQDGKQTLARQALSSVANQSGLDAASNEDARVQLESLQTQQALVGLNTRRQRIYLDRSAEEASGFGSEQLRESAVRNPVIQIGDLNFRPDDLSQLLQGNTNDEISALRKIATRIVQQQQGGEAAGTGLDVVPPYEGRRYRFSRGVQVSENDPLTLELSFSPIAGVGFWRGALVGVLLLAFAMLMSYRKPAEAPRMS